jgi:tetratricopeptide (TPR) repeat protein
MSFDQFSLRFFRMIAVDIGLTPWFVAAAVLIVVGFVIALATRFERSGWVISGLGTLLVWFGLSAIDNVQTETKISSIITARLHNYSDYSRKMAQLGMVAVPALAGLVYWARKQFVRAKQRALLSTYLRIANKAYYDGDFDRAIDDFSLAIRIEPRRGESIVKRGQAFRERGLYDKAEADFNRALTLDPHNALAYFHRGIVQASRNDHYKAIGDLDRAFDLDPGNAAILLHRGLSFVKLGDASKAAEDFRRILRMTNHADLAEPAKFHLNMLEPPTTTHEAIGHDG